METPDYLSAQRKFWNVDYKTARMGRVDTVSASDADYERLADADAELVTAVPIRMDGHILEIGCGVGRLLTRIAARAPGATLYGTDISENMISYARAALPSARLHATTGADLGPIESDSIDFAYSNDVFIHIADPGVVASYLKEVFRVLKPGAFFRFNVRHFDTLKAFSNSPGGLWAKFLYLTGIRTPVAFAGLEFNGIQYRPRDIRKLVSEAGLTVESISEPKGRKFWTTARKPPT